MWLQAARAPLALLDPQAILVLMVIQVGPSHGALGNLLEILDGKASAVTSQILLMV